MIVLSPLARAPTWGSVFEVSKDQRTEYQWYPAVASYNGQVYVAWADRGDRDYDLFFRAYDGSSWQPEQEISADAGSEWQWEPSLAVDAGTVHLVWQDAEDGDWDIHYRSRSPGGVWGTETTLSVDAGTQADEYPSVAANGGKVYVVWSRSAPDPDIYFREYDGSSWLAQQEISVESGVSVQGHPVIAADASGQYVVWEDLGGGDYDIAYRARSGPSWGSVQEISQDVGAQAQTLPYVTADNGAVHAVWTLQSGADQDIQYRGNSGGTWGAIQEVSQDTGTEFQDVSQAFALGGQLHVVWADHGDGDWDIRYRSLQSGTWSSIQEVSVDAGSPDQWDPAVSAEGTHLHVVWEDQSDGDKDIYYRQGTVSVSSDVTPPRILNVALDGLGSQTRPLSTLPPTMLLTATVDDTATGNSDVGGANYTTPSPTSFPSTLLAAVNPPLDAPSEGMQAIVTPSRLAGTSLFCVRAWDVVPNYNNSAPCASLTVTDDVAPQIRTVRINGQPAITIGSGTPSVVLTDTLDDRTEGGSDILAANYTLGAQAWPGLPMSATDGLFDEAMEDVTATVGTGSLGLGPYSLCVYGSDTIPNHNVTGACASLTIVGDAAPPAIAGPWLNGLATQTVGLSSLPGSMLLTATIDDSSSGGSNIAGANYTFPAANSFPATPMAAADGAFDAIAEDVQSSVNTALGVGAYGFCVRAWDGVLNANNSAPCADLTVLDDLPPLILNVRADGLTLRVITPGTPSVLLTATVDDSTRGGSGILQANYTIGAANWPGTAMSPSDGSFDSASEIVEATMDTSAWGAGTYTLCAYGSDIVPNPQTTGLCATVVVSGDTTPPQVLSVLINGQASLSLGLSGLPPSLTLTATIDDAATGASVIGGANYTTPTASSFPSFPLGAADGAFDAITEAVQATVSTPAVPGTVQFCVRGWDAVPNYDPVASCATLTVTDDLPPAVRNVTVEGQPSLVLPIGTPSVLLEAVVDDSAAGASSISAANYTIGAQAWPGTALAAKDGGFDEAVEGVAGSIPVASWAAGMYALCVYGSDAVPNPTLADACATLVLSADVTPPEIRSVRLDGFATFSTPLSLLPSILQLTAEIDDSFTGANAIAGANFTTPTATSFPATPLPAVDGVFDEALEDVQMAVTPARVAGPVAYCVRAWDAVPNYNATAACATLVVVDDLPPEVLQVRLNGATSASVSPGTSVALTAILDDSTTGASILGGANYTVGAGPGASLISADGTFDEILEDVSASVDTTGWSPGLYSICVHGWDSIPNFNATGSCATLTVTAVAGDTAPPRILAVTLGGSSVPSLAWSTLPAALEFRATADDTLTGGSVISGLNVTVGPAAWPGAMMGAVDGAFDSAVEEATALVTIPAVAGSFEYCAYGSDAAGNANASGACLTLQVFDDRPPAATLQVNGTGAVTVGAGTVLLLTATADDSAAGNSTIVAVNFTVDGGWPGTAMTPVDGAFDRSVETFSLSLDTTGWSVGTHTVRLNLLDASGNAVLSGASVTITIVRASDLPASTPGPNYKPWLAASFAIVLFVVLVARRRSRGEEEDGFPLFALVALVAEIGTGVASAATGVLGIPAHAGEGLAVDLVLLLLGLLFAFRGIGPRVARRKGKG